MMRRCLPGPAAHRICPRMRPILTGFAILLLFTATGAQAQTRKPPPHAAPAAATAATAKKLATFEDWTAAIHQESGQTVCYAFTRAMSSVPALPGRGDVVLTVTERPIGRDAVAMSAGFAYAAGSRGAGADRPDRTFSSTPPSATPSPATAPPCRGRLA